MHIFNAIAFALQHPHTFHEALVMIEQHPLITYIVFCNIVSTMPTPPANASLFYTWLFRFLHVTASNLGRVMATRNGIAKIEVDDAGNVVAGHDALVKEGDKGHADAASAG